MLISNLKSLVFTQSLFLPILALAMAEQEIIRTTFSFLSLLNTNRIEILTPTELLVYTMMSYMGKESSFLEEELDHLLSTFVRNVFTPSMQFKLDEPIGG